MPFALRCLLVLLIEAQNQGNSDWDFSFANDIPQLPSIASAQEPL
jgi:hypothetical protein